MKQLYAIIWIITILNTLGMLAHNNSNDIRKKIENYSFSLSDRIGKGYSSTVYKGRNDLTGIIHIYL